MHSGFLAVLLHCLHKDMNLRHAFWCCFDSEQFVCLMDSLDRALIGSVKQEAPLQSENANGSSFWDVL